MLQPSILLLQLLVERLAVLMGRAENIVWWQLLLLLLSTGDARDGVLAGRSSALGRELHWHEGWESGAKLGYAWYTQPWVEIVRDFYCDSKCEARLQLAPIIDREFKALVDLFNQTTGGPRDVYRGAFEGLDRMHASSGTLTRRAASLNKWKHMEGWESILTAHTSALTLCTKLKLDGSDPFVTNEKADGTARSNFCYANINASTIGPMFPNPRWSVIEDCCLKYNQTVRQPRPRVKGVEGVQCVTVQGCPPRPVLSRAPGHIIPRPWSGGARQ